MSKKNKYHKEYGVFSNTKYILGCIVQHKKILFLIIIIGALADSMMQYLWGFIGKFVIDIVEQQAQSTDKSIKPLVTLLCITTAIELVSMAVNEICSNRRWFNFIYVRMKVIVSKRIPKTLSLNYQALEDPEILNCMVKAEDATGSNKNGIEGMLHTTYALLVQIFIIIATMSIIFTLSPLIIGVVLVLSVFQFFFFNYTVKKDKKEIWDELSPHWRKIHYLDQVTQDFSYAKDIRLFGMKKWLSLKQEEIFDKKHKLMVKSRIFWIYNSVFTHSIILVTKGVIYGYLIYSVLYKGISIGNFTLYLSSALTFSSAITNLLNSAKDHKARSLEMDDFRSFMDIENVDDNAKTIPLPKANSWKFQFKNVSFKYKNQENYAVKNLNLTLEPGKRLAVVGLNGAGKTTFIKLLLRLYDVEEGEILLNGVNIKSYNRIEYYKLFSPVFQNVEIFAFPMSENVSMKSPNETDVKKAEEMLIFSGMEEKLKSLKNGVNSELLKIIHDDGIELSGGEKQKLALARALYKNSPIIVLDEPTAALDALAESKLYNDFDKIIGEKTAIYISHRLSSTRFCDAIAMFANGEMVEYGTHDELMCDNGEYAHMFAIQSHYYKDEKVVI